MGISDLSFLTFQMLSDRGAQILRVKLVIVALIKMYIHCFTVNFSMALSYKGTRDDVITQFGYKVWHSSWRFGVAK